MEKLLHWSIANAQGDKEAIERAGPLDPKLLDQLFNSGGAADDPTLMKAAMIVATNPDADLENRLIAFDNFEMLIENLDNANNMENMKLWEPVIATLDDLEPDLRSAALSVIGTAVQNNPEAQKSYIKYENSLPKLLTILEDDKEAQSVKLKALYALSNVVRNHKDAAEVFLQYNGLNIIAPVLSNPQSSAKLKTRVLSLLVAVFSVVPLDQQLVDKLRNDHIIELSISQLDPPNDLNLVDRILNFLTYFINAKVKFGDSEVTLLRKNVQGLTEIHDKLNEEDYSIVKSIL